MEKNQYCTCETCATISKHETGRDNIENLMREIQNVKTENDFLKEYLVTVRNNATLKTANALTSILVWSDRQLCQRFKGLYFIGQSLYLPLIQCVDFTHHWFTVVDTRLFILVLNILEIHRCQRRLTSHH